MLVAEIGPEHRQEDELRIGRLPEQEIADPLLAGRADDEVGIGNARRVERLLERRVVDRFGPQLAAATRSASARAARTISSRAP